MLTLLVPAILALGPDIPPRTPNAIVDLRTREGTAMVKGEWRYHDARLVEVDHRLPGPDNRPTGAPTRTMDISPKAGPAEFDDSGWATLDPESLESRRGLGRFSGAWYRLHLTIPERVGAFDAAGSTVVLEVVMDDYAEVWVDGRLPTVLGQSGGALVKGWNAANRVVVARDARPGQRVTVAVFALNGPVSDPPANYIWVRSATLDFYTPERLTTIKDVPVEVLRVDPGIDAVIPESPRLERLADGFTFTEGPLWVPASVGGAGASPIGAGYLLFSDPNQNVIHRWSPDDGLSVYRTKSGYTGVDIGEYGQPGSNGLALDRDGRVTICEHGNRRVTRLEKNGTITVLADRYEGKRLNSPNDLVYRSDGVLYFTDPPFGLPKFHDDPRRELPHCGVYAIYDGRVKLVSTDMKGPNGLAFSPDERYLYVGNWDVKKKVVMRYEVQPDGTLAGGLVFFDMTGDTSEIALDGLKVDRAGNLFVSGPGGVWVISSAGKHLGTIRCPELPANFAWGDEDRKTLYLAARTGIYRMRMNIAGAGQ